MRAPGFRFSGLKTGFSAVKAAGTGLLFDLYLSVMERGLTRRFLCVVVACMGATMVLPAQSAQSPSRMKQFNITVNFENYTVKTQVLGQSKSLSADNERSYLWYSSQKIMETRGGYDGKLIHGIYRAFYLNDQLKERGRIRYGIRQGEWKYWYPDGKLKEVITWKKGFKQGPYALYNDYGQLMARGRFRKDKLHGMFRTYAPGGQLADKKKYRRGEEVTPKKTRSLKREKKLSHRSLHRRAQRRTPCLLKKRRSGAGSNPNRKRILNGRKVLSKSPGRNRNRRKRKNRKVSPRKPEHVCFTAFDRTYFTPLPPGCYPPHERRSALYCYSCKHHDWLHPEPLYDGQLS
jgi:hypothetical protein